MPVTAFAVVHSAAHADLEHLVEVDLILLTVDFQLQRLLALGVGGRSKGPRSGAPCSRRLAGPRTTWPGPPRPTGNPVVRSGGDPGIPARAVLLHAGPQDVSGVLFPQQPPNRGAEVELDTKAHFRGGSARATRKIRALCGRRE